MAKNQLRPVKFSCTAPKAKAVFLAGTFNGWKADAVPLQLERANGRWTRTLRLPVGHHEN